MNVFSRRQREFGSVYGVFEGNQPRLVVSDPVILKKIFISDFGSFTNRRQVGFDHPLEQKIYIFWDASEWREARNTLTPTFSSGKIKCMAVFIQEAVDRMLQALQERVVANNSREVEVKALFKSYLLNVIGKTMFGIQLDTYDKESLEPKMYSAFCKSLTPSMYKIILSMILPKWFKTMMKYTVFDKESLNAYEEVARAIISERIKSQTSDEKKQDFISLMLRNRELQQDSSGRKFSDDELVANSRVFLVAGTDSTTTSLSCITLMLATHEDIQDKLYQEIRESIESRDDIQSVLNTIQNMPYLDSVMNETLRLYPPAIFTERRVSSSEYVLKTPSGHIVSLPKDTLIMIPIYTIHRNERNFHDANSFLPERFMGENKGKIDPITFHPFGHGPRNCIGIRLAVLTLKFAIISILLRYRLEAGPRTGKELDISQTNADFIVTPDIFVRFVERE